MELPMSAEERAIAGGRGKWSQKGVPHKGWSCTDVEDRGEPDMVCEMCESQSIRYVHYMEHPNYPQVLGVGCVCAGHLEEDLVRAAHRDSQMKSRSSKRSRWLWSRKWKVSKKGNDWIEDEGYRITIFPQGDGWAASVVNDATNKKYFTTRPASTANQAKLGAFDFVTKLLAGKAV